MSFLEKLTESEKAELRKFILETVNKKVSISDASPEGIGEIVVDNIVRRISESVRIAN